jgi:parallel beta-helix repeat protein
MIVILHLGCIASSDDTSSINLPSTIIQSPELEPSNYTSHGPILITSNEDFASQGFPGSGTKDDPYLIEGYSISEASGVVISIFATDAYFIIRENLIEGQDSAEWGIYLHTVKNGKIENNVVRRIGGDGIGLYVSVHITIVSNEVHEVHNGIWLESSSENNLVDSNLVYNNQGDGILVGNSNYNIIQGNSVYDAWNGISLFGSTFNTMISNTIYQNNWFGMNLVGSSYNTIMKNTIYENVGGIRIDRDDENERSSNNNIIYQNTIHDEADEGIHLDFALSTIISHNTISNSLYNGIRVEASGNVKITNNVISLSGGYGLNCYGCFNVEVSWNNFYQNIAPDGWSQAYDHVAFKYGNNIFSYNYWDDGSTRDDNGDGIADIPYAIDGPDNRDYSPLVGIKSYPQDYTLSLSNLMYPNAENTVNGTVHIIWTPAIDSHNPQVTYTIFYSANDGETWSELAQTTMIYYTWDTCNLINGEYLIRIRAEDTTGLVNEVISQPFTVSNPFLVTISALIDGTDELIMQDNKIWYNHLYAQLPGRFNDTNEPTDINDYQWYPIFPLGDDEPQESLMLTDCIRLPWEEIEYQITDIVIVAYDDQDPVVERTEELVNIDQQPLENNNFSLVVTVDDGDPIGAAWYTFTITAKVQIPITTTPTTTSTTTAIITTTIINGPPETNEPDDNPFSQIGDFLIGLIILIAIVGGVLAWANQRPRIPSGIVDSELYPDVSKEQIEQFDPRKAGIRYCGHCGAKNDLVGMFCGYCGSKF